MKRVVGNKLFRVAAVGVVGGALALSLSCLKHAPASLPEQPQAPRMQSTSAVPMKASHYGRNDGFEGRKTASGEVFRSDGLTAAHKTLPFGTKLEVTNPDNGKRVTVRVNDRGPFVKGRQIDLSTKAAEKLGVEDEGVAEVVVTPLDK